jgi:hypothetical protein
VLSATGTVPVSLFLPRPTARSPDRSPSAVGRGPLRPLPERVRVCRPRMCLMEEGIVPPRLVSDSSRCFIAVRHPMLSGIGPTWEYAHNQPTS